MRCIRNLVWKEDKKMKAERIVKLIGVSLILYSIILLSSSIISFVKILPSLEQLRADSEWRGLSYIPYYGLFSVVVFFIFYVLIGIYLIKLQIWARETLLFLFFMFLILLIKHLFVFGFIAINTWIPSWEPLILISIYVLLSSSKFKNVFLVQKTAGKRLRAMKVIIISIVVLVILSSAFIYVVMAKEMLSRGADLFYKPKKIVLTSMQKSISDNYAEHRLGILKFSLPPDFKIAALMKSDNQYTIGVKDSAGHLRITIVINHNFFRALKPIYTILGFNDAYEFGHYFIREKFGRMFQKIKLIGSEKGRYDEVESDTWKGFVYSSLNRVEYLYFFDIFTKKDGIPFELAFYLSKSNKNLKEIADNKETADNIVASLEFVDTSLGDHKVLFAKGLEQLKNNKFEDAKYTFINCLLKDYNKLEYHFYLAKAHKETGDLVSTRYHLKEVLKIDPKNIEAKKLLSSIPEEVKQCR